MNSELIIASIMTILPMLPLFILVLVAIIYAANRHESMGLPAKLVMIGGILVLLSLVMNMLISVLLITQSLSTATIGAVAGISGLVTMIMSTIGWGMILYAVFADRKRSAKLDF